MTAEKIEEPRVSVPPQPRPRRAPDLLDSAAGAAAVMSVVAVIFFTLRLALLFGRDTFYDELFTHWIAAKSFVEIVRALMHDSGPPLYYFVVHALGNPPILWTRAISLLFAAAAAATIALAKHLGTERFLAVALLAAYPAAVLSAVDARSYGLAALFVTLGIVALRANRPFAAATAFVAAAYTHYYGGLFFPLLLLPTENRETLSGRSLRRVMGPLLLACVFFLPGFWLAAHQPRDAMQWLTGAFPLYAPLLDLSFAHTFPSLIVPAPPAVSILALALLAVAVSRTRDARLAAYTIVPVVEVLALGLIGRAAYFPLRFESVIATPLALWIASSLERWPAIVRRTIATALVAIGILVCYRGVLVHVRRPLDVHARAAIFAARQARPGEPIVGAGFAYLQALAIDGPRVVPFLPEQAVHPGWYVRPTVEQARRAGSLLPHSTFVYIGEVGASETRALSETHAIEPLSIIEDVIIARARQRNRP